MKTDFRPFLQYSCTVHFHRNMKDEDSTLIELEAGAGHLFSLFFFMVAERPLKSVMPLMLFTCCCVMAS